MNEENIVMDNMHSFREWIREYLEETGVMEFGYDNGDCWERYIVEETYTDFGENGVNLYLKIGSTDGSIPYICSSQFISWFEFYKVVLTKKFKNPDFNMYRLIVETA